jgi:four helix bundle protein
MTCEILDLVALLPNDRVTGVVSNQILRSASSIAANIAEGHGRYAPGAYRNHLSIARGSTEETISWIDLMARRGMIVPEQEASALRKCAELMKMLTAKMVQLSKAVSRPNALGEEPAAYDVEAFDV